MDVDDYLTKPFEMLELLARVDAVLRRTMKESTNESLAIFLFSAITLRTNLDGWRERSLGEHYFIASTYGKDLFALESRGTAVESSLGTLFQSYSAYYSKQGVALELSGEGGILFSSLPKDIQRSGYYLAVTPRERTVTTTKLNDRTFVNVTGNLPAPYMATQSEWGDGTIEVREYSSQKQ